MDKLDAPYSTGTGCQRMQQIHCEGCGQLTPGYDIVHYGSIERGYRDLCSRCFNAEVAKRVGLEAFEHTPFEPIGLTDCMGETHEFHFRTRLFGTGLALEAFELRDGYPGGYQFEVIGNPEEDQLALLGRLIERMRRALAIKHLVDDKLGLQIADHQIVRGLITWDENSEDRMPLLVIDGREISWDEFGRMLMTFEGWQFKLEIRDKSEEV
jgi:hypothetical protein